MKSARTTSITLRGLVPELLHVNVTCREGNSFHLLNVPEARVRETRIRVRAALSSIGVSLDNYEITVDAPGATPAIDLAIAMAILVALGVCPAYPDIALFGELSLSGQIRAVRGILPAMHGLALTGLYKAIVPRANAQEAANIGDDELFIYPAEHIGEVVAHFGSGAPLIQAVVAQSADDLGAHDLDLSEIHNQPAARRAAEIAAAGGHNLLLVGPPGCGKTALARRIPTIMPAMTEEEAIEVSSIHSIAGTLPPAGILTCRPFRAPHHTVSATGLVGGGNPVRPGEASLAHNGVLYLDELSEFRRSTIDALLPNMRDGVVTIFRGMRYDYPADALIVGGAAPCPCGWLGEPGGCVCTPERVAAYQKRLRGLLHFPLRVTMAPRAAGGGARRAEETSAGVRERVEAARAIQAARCERGRCARSNGQLSASDVGKLSALLSEREARLLFCATERLFLTERERLDVLRVARTIADFDDAGAVCGFHIAEAIHLSVGWMGAAQKAA